MSETEYPKVIPADELKLYGGLLKCEWCNATTEIQWVRKHDRLIVECIGQAACNERDCDLHAKEID